MQFTGEQPQSKIEFTFLTTLYSIDLAITNRKVNFAYSTFIYVKTSLWFYYFTTIFRLVINKAAPNPMINAPNIVS